jgi:hypothetical protein
MFYYLHYLSYVCIQNVFLNNDKCFMYLFRLYCCIITNALHAYGDCLTHSISVKIYGRWIIIIIIIIIIQKQHAVEILRKNYQPDEETSYAKHEITTDRRTCHLWDSNPQSLDANSQGPKAWRARTLRSTVFKKIKDII